MFATKTFQSDDVIFTERPLVRLRLLVQSDPCGMCPSQNELQLFRCLRRAFTLCGGTNVDS